MADTTFSPGTVVTSTWLQETNDHVFDKGASAKHVASKISVTPSGDLVATNVQTALEEIQTEVVSGLATLTSQKANISGQVFTGDVSVPSLNGGQLAGFRNKVLNGKMELAQSALSIPVPASSAVYTLDQWVVSNLTAAVLTATRENSTITTSGFTKCHRLTVNTADASIAAADNCLQYQPIEGREIADLIGTTFTVQFKVKSPKVGTHCVVLRNGANNLSYVAEYTVNVANTWEKKTFTVVGGLPSSGTWDVDSATGLLLGFTLAAGTTHHTSANSWNVGSFGSTAAQVNCLDTIGNIFETTGIQLEVGTLATPFEHRPSSEEERLCQRFYERGIAAYIGVCTAGEAFGVPISFKARKRVTPTVAFVPGTVSSTTGAGGALASNATPDSMTFQVTAVSTGAAAVSLHYEANARL